MALNTIVVFSGCVSVLEAAQCCYDDALTPDQCFNATDCDGASDYCSSSGGNCNDCGGVFCSDSPPAPSPPVPTPKPEPSPGPTDAKCCYDDGLTPDQCFNATDCDDASDYCSSSSSNCGDCGGVFCSAQPEPTPKPTPAPSPTPSPSPTPATGAKCCYDDGLTPDQCATASDCDDASDYCSASTSNCKDCGGVFCATQPDPTPEPTPAPSPSPVGKTFKCVDGQCVPGAGGIDRKTCKSLCAPVSTFKCVNNQCVQSQGGATKEVCESFCGSQIV